MQKSECRGGEGGGIHFSGGIILRGNMTGGVGFTPGGYIYSSFVTGQFELGTGGHSVTCPGGDLLQGAISSVTGHFELGTFLNRRHNVTSDNGWDHIRASCMYVPSAGKLRLATRYL